MRFPCIFCSCKHYEINNSLQHLLNVTGLVFSGAIAALLHTKVFALEGLWSFLYNVYQTIVTE